MPCVNYVKEHIAFIEYAADNNLRANEILVWEALFHVMNQRANGNYWPDGFIRVKNDRLLTYAPIGFDSLARARNSLAQRGLISYKPGKKNSEVPMYELHYLTAESNPQLHDNPVDNSVDNSVNNTSYPARYPQNTDNIRGNIKDNIGGNAGGNAGGKLSHQYINLNNRQSNQSETYIDDDDEADVGITRGRARGYELCAGYLVDEDAEQIAAVNALADCAAKAIRVYFGRDAASSESRAIAIKANLLHFSGDMIAKAVELSALHGARIPVSYVSRIFQTWDYEEVRTPEEADEYQFMDDAQSGRNPYGSGDAVENYRRMNQAREERRAKHEAEKEGGSYGSYTASGV